MSDAGKGQREWRFYLTDMLSFAQNVRDYTNGLDQAGFVADRIVYDATLRNLELIGEAASHIPPEVRTACPDISWRQLVATRNRLIHAYPGIDDDTIWSIIQDDIPALMVALGRYQRKVSRTPAGERT